MFAVSGLVIPSPIIVCFVVLLSVFSARLKGPIRLLFHHSVGSLPSSIVFSLARFSYLMLAASSKLSSLPHVVSFFYCRWVIVPCVRGAPRWFPVCQNDQRLFGRRHGFAAVTSSFWVQVPLPTAPRSPPFDASSIFFGSFRLPWPVPPGPGARGPPFSVEVPRVFSLGGRSHQFSQRAEPPSPQLPPLLPSPLEPTLPPRWCPACSPPRFPEVPCLPLPSSSLRVGGSCSPTSGCPDPLLLVAPSALGEIRSFAPAQSAARPLDSLPPCAPVVPPFSVSPTYACASVLPASAGCPPEALVVVHSSSTAVPVVLTSIHAPPPISSSPPTAFSLLFTLVTGPPLPPLPTKTAPFAHLLRSFSVCIDSSFATHLPSLLSLLPTLSRGCPYTPTCLPLPPTSPTLPPVPCVGTASPGPCSDFASAPVSPTSPPSHARLPGPTTGPDVCPPSPDRLLPDSPLLDAELGISLPDALASLRVSLPPDQLESLRSAFVATVAPASCSNLARLRRELRRIGASAASILPPGAARTARRALLHMHGPTLLIVVETKLSVVSHACVRTLLRQPSFGYLPANGVAGGILLAWSPPLTGNVVNVGKYSISAILNGLWPNGPVLVTAVYGPCVGALRHQLWAELRHARELASLPWLLAGDFNCLLSPADSFSPITSGPRHLSDHAPLLLSLTRGRAGTGRTRFRFELWWLRDESFVDVVPRWWDRTVNGRWAAFRLSRKLHCIRREVIAWKRIFWSGKFSEVAIWDEEILSIQSSDNVSTDQSSRLLCLQSLAQEWRIRESIHWQQRSRLGWLAHGDQNSRFFHLAASQRRRQALLQSMVIGHREFLGEDILPALTAHFRDFYCKPAFSTLQYADDFLLFGTAFRQQIVRTWLILRVFELVSGLSINSSKCHLSLVHADPTMVLLAEACFGCKATGLPMDYLGLQITLSPPTPSFWDGVEHKLFDRLHCWQGKLLSLPGRITLAKHCLASIPLHVLAVFRPPAVVLKRFDEIIRNFIWDGDRPSDCLARWDMVALPRLLGGAGVTNLSRACESSLCSWWWRLATEFSLISRFICSKYDMSSPSDWNISISHTSPSHFWSGLLPALPLFLRLADLPPLAPPSWPLSSSGEYTFSSCYLASFGSSVASLPPQSFWSPGPSPRAVAFVWLLLNGHINTFDHLQRLGISLANQCPLCLAAAESRVHLFTSCPFFCSVLASAWPSFVNNLSNPPSIHLFFLFCPSSHLSFTWGRVWRFWLISSWWRIWEERNNRVFRDTFSSSESVARLVQGDVHFAIRLRRRPSSTAG
ncbi:putative ribonuclease H protein [Nymphaea thermarum]|nr:putative ribonuclease H protein [Nymphaea thermarum]